MSLSEWFARPPGWSRFQQLAYLVAICDGLYVAGGLSLYPFLNEFVLTGTTVLSLPFAVAAGLVIFGLIRQWRWAFCLTWIAATLLVGLSLAAWIPLADHSGPFWALRRDGLSALADAETGFSLLFALAALVIALGLFRPAWTIKPQPRPAASSPATH